MSIVWALVFCVVATVLTLGLGWVLCAMSDEKMQSRTAKWRRWAIPTVFAIILLNWVISRRQSLGMNFDPAISEAIMGIALLSLYAYPVWIAWKWWTLEKMVVPLPKTQNAGSSSPQDHVTSSSSAH